MPKIGVGGGLVAICASWQRYHPCATLSNISELGLQAHVGENDPCCDSSCCDTICNSSHIQNFHSHEYFWLLIVCLCLFHISYEDQNAYADIA